MVDRERLHINGRHFALMKAVVGGHAAGEPSTEMLDLIRWGFVIYDGEGYDATVAGNKANETWQNMKDVGD